MKNYYKRFYSRFDEARYRKLMNGFGLDENRKLRTILQGHEKAGFGHLRRMQRHGLLILR